MNTILLIIQIIETLILLPVAYYIILRHERVKELRRNPRISDEVWYRYLGDKYSGKIIRVLKTKNEVWVSCDTYKRVVSVIEGEPELANRNYRSVKTSDLYPIIY